MLEIVGEQVNSIKMDFVGATPFIIFTFNNKNKRIGLSIDKRKADLYEFESDRNLDNSFSILENLAFSEEIGDQKSGLNMFVIVDKLMDFPKISKEGFQGLYQFLYDKSKSVMVTKDKMLIKELSDSVASIIQFSDTLENPHKDKFFQNISDMLQAIKDEDLKYFGITDIKTARLNK